jgi:hypothetical protein
MGEFAKIIPTMIKSALALILDAGAKRRPFS